MVKLGGSLCVSCLIVVIVLLVFMLGCVVVEMFVVSCWLQCLICGGLNVQWFFVNDEKGIIVELQLVVFVVFEDDEDDEFDVLLFVFIYQLLRLVGIM